MAFCVLDNPRLLYEIMAMIPPLLAYLFLPCARASEPCKVRCIRASLGDFDSERPYKHPHPKHPHLVNPDDTPTHNTPRPNTPRPGVPRLRIVDETVDSLLAK